GVIYNGEIYNHHELRRELERRGHRFASGSSDTEVLVHGWEEWGADLPVHLNGMFAFAILDRRGRRLFLARDRFGENARWYTARPGLCAFASELTALLKHSGVPSSIKPRALQKLFAYGYIPSPLTIVEGAAKLPGGHWLSYDLATGRILTKPYWQFVIEPDLSLNDADEPRLVEECAALLTEASRRRLMSDVALGVFLSGGLDSSLVLASLAQFQPAESLSTFTIGFHEPSFDESAYADIVARHIGSCHHLRTLHFDQAQPMIDAVLGRLDEPLG